MTKSTKPPANPVRVILFLLWSLLPILAIYVGLYTMGSAFWAYVFYHVFCLLPAIIWGRKLWQDSLRLPTLKEWLILLAAALLFSAVTIVGFELLGKTLLSDEDTLQLMKRVGWYGQIFWPMSIYAVVVNPVLEELFWRGVVLNELDKLQIPIKNFSLIWSSVAYAAFHYSIFRLVLFPVYAEIGTFGLVLYGALMAFIYRKTGSIVTTAAAHGMLTDMAALALMIDLFRRHPNFL